MTANEGHKGFSPHVTRTVTSLNREHRRQFAQAMNHRGDSVPAKYLLNNNGTVRQRPHKVGMRSGKISRNVADRPNAVTSYGSMPLPRRRRTASQNVNVVVPALTLHVRRNVGLHRYPAVREARPETRLLAPHSQVRNNKR